LQSQQGMCVVAITARHVCCCNHSKACVLLLSQQECVLLQSQQDMCVVAITARHVCCCNHSNWFEQ